MKTPTQAEFQAYDGAHCPNLWSNLPEGWRCPACGRSKLEIMRWTRRYYKKDVGKCAAYMGWMAGLHAHHDHSKGLGDPNPRFPETVICDQCNAADGAVKRKLGLPESFSFSPIEIRQFIVATPHGRHKLDFDAARSVYGRVVGKVD